MQYTVRLRIDENQTYIKKYEALIEAGAEKIKRTNKYIFLKVDNKLRHKLPTGVQVLSADYKPIAKINVLEKSENYQFRFLQELNEQSQIYEVEQINTSKKNYYFILGTFSIREGANRYKQELSKIVGDIKISPIQVKGKYYWRLISPEYQRSVYDRIRRELNRKGIEFETRFRFD